MHSVARILPVVLTSMLAIVAHAQDSTGAATPLSQSPVPASSGWPGIPLFEEFDLFSEWSDARADVVDQGITFDLSTTQFYQGVPHGGLKQQFQYGGRNDYFLKLDGEKAGLWEGGSLALHGETRYGESANTLTGALAPVNLMLSVPLANGSVSGLTGVTFTQALSENMQIYAGKLNTLDDFQQPLTGAGPLQGFQNSALIYNPVYARTIPYSTFGAGFAYESDSERTFDLVVYDTNNTPTVSGFDTMFSNGVTIYAEATAPTDFFDLPGHQGVSGTYSTGTYTDLTSTAYLDPTNGLVIESTPVKGSWCLTYSFDQALFVFPDDPERMWGVFGNLGIADKNPSPVQWFATAGVSGTSPLSGRKADTFGIAYFYMGVSDSLKRSAVSLLSLGNESGFEMYYNVAVTSRCQITPDLQVISPFRNRADPSLLVGLRAKFDF